MTLKYLLLISSLALSLNNHAEEMAKQPMNDLSEQSMSVSAKQVLKQRLAGFTHFSASFSQEVIDEEKNILKTGHGDLAVKKPNLVYWNTLQPEESLIVSDGSTLWIYDPFIEQVIAYNVDASVANTPILLLTSSDDKLWEQYTVSQQDGNNFLIHSNDTNNRVKTLALHFKENSTQLKSFSILDSTGQLSVITLQNVQLDKDIKSSLFEFTLPEGVDLDDQR
jgi:outer membrane lipoprotein carrier protein